MSRRVPTHLRILRGNPGKRALPKNEPRPKHDLLLAPEWLSDSEKVGWSYVISQAPAGMLKTLDRAVLAVFVIAEDKFRRAVEEINRSGLTAPSSQHGSAHVRVPSPHLRIMKQQSEIMLRCIGELGFSPVSRSRVEVLPAARDGEADEWEGLLPP
jgi:P27 family predicted phage terminase small subunit